MRLLWIVVTWLPVFAVADLRTARQAYAAKDFARACTLFRAAAQRRPTNGRRWAELGLCELRLGHTAASVKASYHAVRLGNRKTRLNAYYNLWKAGVELSAPPKHTGCRLVPTHPALGCGGAVRGCWFADALDGNGGGQTTFTWAIASPTEADVLLSPRIPVFEEHWISSRVCDPADEFPQTFDRFSALCVRRGWGTLTACKAATTQALDLEGARSSHMERRLARVIKRHIDRCNVELRREARQMSGTVCVIVAVDQCRDRLGMVCDATQGDFVEAIHPAASGPRWIAVEYSNGRYSTAFHD